MFLNHPNTLKKVYLLYKVDDNAKIKRFGVVRQNVLKF